ncbi:MAG TPA: hypothetical protein VIL70_00070 [Chthoniobacterales bacterium]
MVKSVSPIFIALWVEIITPHQSSETAVADIVKIGPSAGKTLIGIYEFEGDDQYKLV